MQLLLDYIITSGEIDLIRDYFATNSGFSLIVAFISGKKPIYEENRLIDEPISAGCDMDTEADFSVS